MREDYNPILQMGKGRVKPTQSLQPGIISRVLRGTSETKLSKETPALSWIQGKSQAAGRKGIKEVQTYALPIVTLELVASCPGAEETRLHPPAPPPLLMDGDSRTQRLKSGLKPCWALEASAINISVWRWPEGTQQKLWPRAASHTPGSLSGPRFLSFFKIFIYWAAPGLGGSTRDLPSSLQQVRPLVAAYGIWFPDQGLNLGPLHWKCRVLATGPTEQSQDLRCFI